MRKMMVGFALFAVVGVAAYLRFHHKKGPLDVAYAGNRQVTLWSTTAQVREPVAIATFGQRLDILDRFEDQVEVRTSTGATGWTSEHDLLSSVLWEKAQDLDAKAAAMPIEARGHTKVLGNIHIEAGRDAPRVRQLSKDVSVDLLARQPVEVPAANRAPSDEEGSSGEPVQARKEDWWLVRAHAPTEGTFAGWILGRFIELDVPAPLPDYASSAGTRIIAWFDLNRGKDSAGNPKMQYLLVGAKGPEGQLCDFSSVRVYTWGIQRNRYETAFVDSGVCGKLPVELTRNAASPSDVTFSFEDLTAGKSDKRTYHMHQTIVRRVKQAGEAKPHKRSRP